MAQNKYLGLTIVVDTREQKPWVFPSEINVVSKKLNEGDYAIEGIEETGIVFERKTVADFCSTIVTGKDRFERECDRLSKHDYAFVVVEGDIKSLRDHTAIQHPLMTWSQMRGLTARLCLHRHVRVLFFNSTFSAQEMVLNIIKLYYKDIQNNRKEDSATTY